MLVSVMKNKNKVITIIFVFIFLVLIIPVGVKLFLDLSTPAVEAKKEISNIDYYGYSLKVNHTKVYKEVYKELDKVLSSETIDYKSYASLIPMLFYDLRVVTKQLPISFAIKTGTAFPIC